MLRERDESEYLPQPEDIRHKRDIMEFAIAQLREKRLQNLSAKRVATRDVQMSLIKEQVLDLQDKFDYFILNMIKNGSME